MRIAILSRGPNLYSTKRLAEACRKRRHHVTVYNTLEFSMRVEQGRPNLFYRQQPVPKLDAVIPRIGASITFFGAAVVRQFEQMGVACLNSSLGLITSRDKLRALQMLSRHEVGIVPTVFVRQQSDVLPAIEAVGGAPVVIKLLEGTHGVGVALAETTKMAEAIMEMLQSAKQNVLVQKFVKESRGRDIRAFVVGGRVVAAMRRVAAGDEFRSNVHLGGKAAPVKISPAEERTAIRACQIIGLNVAGVDMLETRDGPKVMEVNSSPGLEGIEQATRVDVAKAIVAFLESQLVFPEVDLRERLTLDRGYGVAEIVVDERSALKGVSIARTELRKQDIMVLRISRRGLSFSNPSPDRILLLGDRLLCFGKLAAMRGLLERSRQPVRHRRKRTR